MSPLSYKELLQMIQPPTALARTTDPETSHAAAASFTSAELTASEDAVERVLRALGPADYTRLVQAFQASSEAPQKDSGIRTRCNSLVRKGRVRDTGERILPLQSSKNRMAIVWAVV